MGLGAGGLLTGLQFGSLVGVRLCWGVIAVVPPLAPGHSISTCNLGVNNDFYPNQRGVKERNSCPKFWTKQLILASMGMN